VSFDREQWLASLTPEERAYVEYLEKRAQGASPEDPVAKAMQDLPEDVRQKLEAEREEVEKLREEQAIERWRDKVSKLHHISADREELPKMLRRIEKNMGTAEDADWIIQHFKSFDAYLTHLHDQGAATIFSEIGRRAPGSRGVPETAEEEFMLKVAEIDKKHPELDQVDAYRKALEENPELLDRIRREQG
jgi:hypothetical protein